MVSSMQSCGPQTVQYLYQFPYYHADSLSVLMSMYCVYSQEEWK
jgi:hypothetical protein